MIKSDTERKKMEQVFNSVLQDYEPISKAPSSITKVDGFFQCSKNRIAEFENNFWAKERNKLYKALDYKTGDIILMHNPACRPWRIENGSSITTELPKKTALTFQEAKKALEGGKKTTEINWDEGV